MLPNARCLLRDRQPAALNVNPRVQHGHLLMGRDKVLHFLGQLDRPQLLRSGYAWSKHIASGKHDEQ